MLMGCLAITTSQNVQKINKPHKVWVTTMDGKNHKGILVSSNVDEVTIFENEFSTISVEAVNIKTLKPGLWHLHYR